MLAVCRPDAIGGQAACARMLMQHVDAVEWIALSFPLPKQFGSLGRFLFSLKIIFQSLWICLTKKVSFVHILTACGKSALFEKLIIARILKVTGVKIMLNFQGAFDVYYQSFSPSEQKWIKNLLKTPDIMLCLHDDIASFLIREKIVSPEKIRVIPNAVEVRTEINRNNNAEEKFRLLYLGWLVTNKGLFTLIRSAGILKDLAGVKNFQVDIYGPEIEAGIVARLQQEAVACGAGDLIHFHPPVFGEDKRKVFESAAIFVFPSRMEGFPFVLLEAMEAEMAVVTTNISPMNLVVQHGMNGLLFEIDNAADLAEKIYLLKDEIAAKLMAKEARSTVILHYSVERITAMYNSLYASLPEA